MNTRNLILIIAAIISAAVIAFLSLSPTQTIDPLTLDFDYSINAQIASGLSEKEISMSSPIKIITPTAIEKYCTFFDDPIKQSQVQYCSSTELLDQNDDFLGNIHMIGTPDLPKFVLVILEIPFGETKNVAAVFDTVIDITVCECWESKAPGGFLSVSLWVDGLNEFQRGADTGITTKSSVISLDGKKIQMELGLVDEGKLWKLFVAK